MLGPIVALLLLASPAAGPAQQSCWLLCSSPSPAPTAGVLDQVLGQDPASLNRRLTALEQQPQPSILAPLPSYAPAPSILLPSQPTSSGCTGVFRSPC